MSGTPMSQPWRTAAALLPGLALCVLAPRPVAGASWSPAGPWGGDVRCLAADSRNPQIVYLGTSSGLLYRSDDGGRQWRRGTPGFPARGMSLDDLAVDAAGTLYVGYWEVHGAGGGGARSPDGGVTFELLAGVPRQPGEALAVAPPAPGSLAVGTR